MVDQPDLVNLLQEGLNVLRRLRRVDPKLTHQFLRHVGGGVVSVQETPQKGAGLVERNQTIEVHHPLAERHDNAQIANLAQN
jgi:hypothetical protein